MTVALFPGRFDPVTNGHVDIARRGARLFDRLVVAIHDTKTTLFSTEERVALFTKAVEDCPNVTVKSFAGLVINFAREESAGVLVRGIRAVTGFEAEFDMALMNKRMAPEIESVYLMSSLEHLFISGSRIREVAGLGYDVTDLVPRHVAEALRQKF
ncbi:MAG: pantetheine-phosphate adenylyltransferase [Dehalococcoidia bacterium]|nr:pantetheine-phosphate adenylyltransferase [Dehalococcoidia bacterium]